MDVSSSQFAIERNIEGYLEVLSKRYAQENEQILYKIIVNAKVRIDDPWVQYYDDRGGQEYHVYLCISQTLFVEAAPDKDTIQDRIRNDLNNLRSRTDEYIREVVLELKPDPEYDWRSASGMLDANKRRVTPVAAKRIWGIDSNYRVFLSHKSGWKSETAELKTALRLFEVSAFVAHEDIRPTEQWQEEIEQALASMDAFVALMTPDFHESDWTDQEVGYAFARGVPIIAVNLGRVPYGFIGKFQALTTKLEHAAVEIVKLWLKHNAMLDSYIQALRKCPSWGDGITLSQVLPDIPSLTPEQADKMISA